MIIGLTGCMAAGKSTVSNMLREKGLPIVDADRIAHGTLRKPEVIAALVSAFGKEILDGNGEIVRRELASRAFSTEGGTEKLNNITHPAIRKAILDAASANESRFPAVALDVPLLIESGLHKECDSVWLVCANIETRYARIMNRDGLTRSEARARLAGQIPQWKKKRYADIIIENDGDIDALRRTVDAAYENMFGERGAAAYKR